jgi:acyl carrier protein
MDELNRIRNILRETLQIGDRADELHEDSRLLGAVAEFDSVAVVSVVMSIEQEFGIRIPDGDLSAEVFTTLGSLGRFVSLRTRSSDAVRLTSA